MPRVRTRPEGRMAGSGGPSIRIPVRRALRATRLSGDRLVPTVSRWPLELDPDVENGRSSDAAAAIVSQSLLDYRSGRADQASRAWHDDITWSVRGAPPVGGQWTGADGIFAYHALVQRLSENTFRQRLVALEGCRGSTVSAYLRTSAERRGRRLDIPTLAVFELCSGRIRRVTELPGDHDAWEAFWAG